ncbi:hypothetical protein AB0F17_16170 [Nonomuraea sp. NPDC026600]|uniref:hypothetical protein n=1 Tax=Nonomuraea sp. NPDC026600 TaxID=3155363 RepID=UPI0033F0756F
MSKLGQLVIAWDEVLQRDDYPELMQQLQEWYRSSGHVAFLDQGEAATKDVYQMLSLASLRVGQDARSVPYQQYPDWVRLGVLNTAARWAAGQCATCTHSPAIRRPAPVVSAAWKPDLIVCTSCAHLLELPRLSAADKTCDGCGYVVPDTETIWSFTVSHGWLMFQAGACDACRFWPL